MPSKQPSQTCAWGTRYDTLPSSPPLSPEAKQDEAQPDVQDSAASPESQARHKEDKQPHDASVFVGSLPSNVDQAELTRLLTVHLSEYAEIKSIKVIRDSKGGVCAFVQCEDATSASAFLQSLHLSPPKPFLGRILRYEPARAFRTLLISYRMPSQGIAPDGSNWTSPQAMDDIPPELPHTIRLWKPKNTKYYRIAYNGDAVEAEKYFRAISKDSMAPVNEVAVFLQPLKFDAESIMKLARFFGPLERVTVLTERHELVKVPKNGVLSPEYYPPPHNVMRSKEMDSRCWEVKWDHRDDCVAALMTLRRVPHLSVSWAHQPQSQTVEQRSQASQPHLPGHRYPAASQVQPKIDRFQPYNTTFSSPLDSTSFSGDISPNSSARDNSTTEDKPPTLLKSATLLGADDSRAWAEPMTPPGLSHKIGGEPSSARVKRLDPPLPLKIDWADADFPSFADSDYDSKLDWSVWGETTFENDIRTSSIIASRSVCEVSTPQRSQLRPSVLQVDEISTPALAMSPTTPQTTLSQVPVTPTNQSFVAPFSGLASKGAPLQSVDTPSRSGRELDPTTLFVGGLEMFGPGAWTEEKVQACFGRFGGLEYVRFVRPPNGSAAYAFVKYNNRDSPAQAIMEEHNRVYAGRSLKVQLRDINPPRSPWKQNRSRGRFSHYHPSRRVMLSTRRSSQIPQQEELSAQHASKTDVDANPMTPLQDTAQSSSDASCHEHPTVDKQQEAPMARVLETSEEKYREWYDAPGAASTTESGSVSSGSAGPPLATPAMPYPLPPPGYYPMPWIPYAQPAHYQLGYYAPYSTYPMPRAPVPPYPATPPGLDANGLAAQVHPWPNMMYNAYTPYFGPPRPAVEQRSSPPVTNPGAQSTQLSPTQPSQAPLVPSGFIQNDQGTLIAVYPPDALDQYMSGQGNLNVGSGDSDSSTSTQSISTTATWPSTQTIHGSTSTFSVPPQASSNPHRMYPVPANPFWNPLPPPFPPLPPGVVAGSATPTYNVNAAARAGDLHDHTGTSSPSGNFGKKQVNRREFHQLNGNRSSRSFNARNGRGHMHNQNLTGNTEGVNLHYRNSQFVNNSDWNQCARR